MIDDRIFNGIFVLTVEVAGRKLHQVCWLVSFLFLHPACTLCDLLLLIELGSLSGPLGFWPPRSVASYATSDMCLEARHD